ncbi:hypothetical protein [Actinophytocola xinjiangensis]|uniref:hypothetical protein n=1 Tax=Actinophytocola xinjiangensis TaxID=485602 RepID=UPI000AD4CC13|nr:hypothetical protein [Actinophytocola xinjiangensis]
MREHLRDGGAAAWAGIPGLRLKFWISDRAGNRWGAVMLWEPGHPRPDQPLPPYRALELIGYPPTERIVFDVEATVEGSYAVAALSGLGLAVEEP